MLPTRPALRPAVDYPRPAPIRAEPYRWPQEHEEEARGHRHLGDVPQEGGLAQPDEGGDRLVQEVDLTHQDVGRLRPGGNLPHELEVALQAVGGSGVSRGRAGQPSRRPAGPSAPRPGVASWWPVACQWPAGGSPGPRAEGRPPGARPVAIAEVRLSKVSAPVFESRALSMTSNRGE